MDVERRLTNQAAFDIVVLHLLNQGHRSFNASGKPKHRGPRGKSAIGALIPDSLYVISMEGKTVQQLLAASGPECERLRERLGGVTASLLGELQDLHDRIGECLPSLFRHLVVAGGHRIAQTFGLSPRVARQWVAYHRLPGPQIAQTAVQSPASQDVAPAQTLGRPSAELKLVA